MKYELISENEIKATPDKMSRLLGMKTKIYITKFEYFEHKSNGYLWYNKKTGNLLHCFSSITKELDNAYRANEFNKPKD